MATEENKCGFEGNADMYGMGIRIGYYLQWYGAILASWIAPSEAQDLRLANSLFVTATFLALVILTVKSHDPSDMPVVETYIILFLAFGSYLGLVPIYVWRVFTCSNPSLDPMRFPRVKPGRVYSVFNTVVLVMVLIFQLWYWVRQVPKLKAEECEQYGFFFWKFILHDKVFMALNIVPSVFLLGVCLNAVAKIGWKIMKKRNQGYQRQKYQPLEETVSPRRKYILQILHSASQCIVATVVIVGVEFTILWNKIDGVHDISSAGQTIPLFLGIASVTTVFYVRFLKKDTVQLLGDGGTGKPQATNGLEMGATGSNASYYNPSGIQAPASAVHASVWDDIPGAARTGGHTSYP